MSVDNSNALKDLVARALAEDLGDGDITSAATVPPDAMARARIVLKAPGMVFGFDAAEEAFEQAGAERFERLIDEAEMHQDVPLDIALAEGPARALLAGERVALNLIGRLSGVATLTARFTAALAGTGVIVLDTRKTTPGLRLLEKAAVVAGGGQNHRSGLYDAILIKENHAVFPGGVGAAVHAAREAQPEVPIEVECRNAAEVQQALEAGAERLLLDNMSQAELRAAVGARNASASNGAGAELEASGGIDLANVAEVAATGVDFVSIGALTHSAPALDLSVLLEPL